MRIIAIAKKVIRELFRDKRTLALMFIAPIFIMWLMNVMFSASTTVDLTLGTKNIPNQVQTVLKDADNVTLKKYTSNQNLKDDLNNDKLDATITYQKDNGFRVTYANTDSSKTTYTRQLLKSAIAKSKSVQLQKISQTILAKTKQTTNTSKMTVSEEYAYGNKDTGFFTKMIPILIGFIIFFFVFLISGMALLKERTSGTLDRLLATPVKRIEIVFGYMLSYGLIAIIQSIVIVCSAIWLLDVELVGSIFNVIIISVCLALVALTFGILMSTLAKSEFQMMQFIPLVVMPQLFFSGIIPLESMADWAKGLGKVLPLSYSGDAMTKIILQGKQLNDVLPDITVLLVFLVILTVLNSIGLKRYRKV
ncbi:DrrB family ABC transporter efflux protein [Streptococcus urinalis FB127-CNA-2]|uniref:ABC transporter, permease protein, DrrB family n=1 Tax=Streptococcus urinalis 2285-97 TaxID=764291 RepID=G5KD90_9STRE|nr:ABC transporter permease [Streptococcus urinalis]EHJ56622.1 ABC transporter, permease protein, DrrB family [Streptococcus urinalis 2285-97]EKS19356.1 DrrB family ABC transporter efflux protein [Streptococcus urinalis FB127-CNA-2]VEF31486.1 ABC transporter [Streptococcus urinalis]